MHAWLLPFFDFENQPFCMKICLFYPLLFAGCGLFSNPVFGQDAGLVFDDFVYLDEIRTVKCHPSGKPFLRPFLLLGRDSMELSFDLLTDEPREFSYTLVHCDADWQPSELDPTDYLTGFEEARMRDYSASFGSRQPYLNYRLKIPNEDLKCSLSGNYLLKIYENEGEKRLAVTRRITFFENRWTVNPSLVPTASVSKSATHQELDFVVKHEADRLASPRRDVRVQVFQNGRTDNARLNVRPWIIHDLELPFDFTDSLTFAAGKEWRRLDLRSLDYRTERVAEIREQPRWFEVWLKADEKRVFASTLHQTDANGGFVIDNWDGRSLLADTAYRKFNVNELFTDNRVQRVTTADRQLLQAEYSLVHFRLNDQSPLDDGREVYLFGGLTDWQIQPQFKLKFDEKARAWFGEAYLKQGFYNYEYAVFDPKTGKIDLSELEGDRYETENRYSILVFYKPFGARYERAVAFRTFSTRP